MKQRKKIKNIKRILKSREVLVAVIMLTAIVVIALTPTYMRKRELSSRRLEFSAQIKVLGGTPKGLNFEKYCLAAGVYAEQYGYPNGHCYQQSSASIAVLNDSAQVVSLFSKLIAVLKSQGYKIDIYDAQMHKIVLDVNNPIKNIYLTAKKDSCVINATYDPEYARINKARDPSYISYDTNC